MKKYYTSSFSILFVNKQTNPDNFHSIQFYSLKQRDRYDRYILLELINFMENYFYSRLLKFKCDQKIDIDLKELIKCIYRYFT